MVNLNLQVAYIALASILAARGVCAQVVQYDNDHAGVMQSNCRDIANAELSVNAEGQQTATYARTWETGRCYGTFRMIQRVSRTLSADGTHFVGVCPGATSTLTQFVKIFDKFVTAHPERLNDDYLDVALDALRDVYPCPVKKRKVP
jgi:hypothetical protein